MSGVPTTSISGINEVYDPSTDTWTTKTSMPTPREGAVANVVHGKIYLIAGNTFDHVGNKYLPVLTNVTEVYDPVTDPWASKAAMPRFYGATAFSEVMSAVINNKIYVMSRYFAVMGSTDFGTLTQIYDPASDSWSLGASIPNDALFAAAGTTTGEMAPKRIYIIGGGYDYDFNPLNLVQVYDPEENVWSNATSMLTPRTGHSVALINYTLYAIGGSADRLGSGIATDLNEQYIPIGYVPEFTSWVILPLFILAILAVILYRSRLRR